MPLHDWSERRGWDGVHLLWISELVRWIKPRLPDGYRAYIGSAPLLAVGAPSERPDVEVRSWRLEDLSISEPGSGATEMEPDVEVAAALLETESALFVERDGRLIAALELVSPRNKDRPAAREACLNRYLSYLLDGVHLVLIDLHPRPLAFSFADGIVGELRVTQARCPSPFANAYRVGSSAAEGGRLLAIWRRPLQPNEPLPNLPLPLNEHASVMLDLERTYSQAADDAYVS